MEIVDYLLARKKAGGGSDVTIEQLSVTENGTYSEQGIAYSPVVVDVPAPENSYQLKDVPSGTISTIEDGTDLPMSSLKVGIEPVQDLHGYDHPWVGGAGKNLFDTPTATSTGTVSIFIKKPVSLKAGTYTLSFKTATSIQTTQTISFYNGDDIIKTYGIIANVTNLTVILPEDCDSLTWYVREAVSLYDIQIEEGSTATSYEPYSNICPISGWTAANVTRSGKNLFNIDNVKNIKLSNIQDMTRYGVIVEGSGEFSISVNCESFTDNDFLYARTYNPDGSIINTYHVISTSTVTPTNFYLSQGQYFILFDAVESSLALSKRRMERWKPQIELGSTATTYEPYSGATYNIQFKDGDNPLTVYGGTLDVTTGELVVDRGYLTNDYLVNTANYESAGRNCYVLIGVTLKTLGASVIDDKLITSALKTGTQTNLYANRLTGIAHWWNTRIGFSTGDSNVTSVSEFKDWLASNGSDVCYELATPTTYHLTPTQIRTLVGTNNIWADTGDIIEGKYFKEL